MSQTTEVSKKQLPSRSPALSRGVLMTVTSKPDRHGGKPFYEMWFRFEGGTMRFSNVFASRFTRWKVCVFLLLLTWRWHGEAIADAVYPCVFTPYKHA